ncbi:MAG: LamG-like jellyroll fold domain-containing protein [Lewinella sp.]|uniref:LamG-like jellyroll fold domain-containing protein n=1 Tax=Lewinella sp. TaxID=2004506 RepID=UPI003D6A2E6C
MRHINSFINAFGNDGYKSIVEYLQANGATSDNENEAWRQFLTLNGFTQDHLEDAYKQWLISLTSGSEYILDMEKFIGENPSLLEQALVYWYFISGEQNFNSDNTIDHSTPLTVGARQGSALDFDGATQDVSVPNFAYTDGTSLAAWAWVKTTDTNAEILAAYRTSGNLRSWRANINASGNLRVVFTSDGTYGASTTKDYFTSSITVNDGNWHFVSFSFANGNLQLNVDNNYNVSVTKTFDAPITTFKMPNTPLTIASRDATTYLNGTISKVGIATIATDLELESLRTCGKLPFHTQEFFPLEEEDGLNAFGIKGNDGTNANSPSYITDNGVAWSYVNKNGYTINGSVIVPAVSGTTDAEGNPLDYSGESAQIATVAPSPSGDDAGGIIAGQTVTLDTTPESDSLADFSYNDRMDNRFQFLDTSDSPNTTALGYCNDSWENIDSLWIPRLDRVSKYASYTFDGIDDNLEITQSAAINNLFDSGGVLGLLINLENASSGDVLIDKTGWRIEVDAIGASATLKLILSRSTTNSEYTFDFDIDSGVGGDRSLMIWADTTDFNLPIVYQGVTQVTVNIDVVGSGTYSDDSASNLFIGSDVSSSNYFEGLIGLPQFDTNTIIDFKENDYTVNGALRQGMQANNSLEIPYDYSSLLSTITGLGFSSGFSDGFA